MLLGQYLMFNVGSIATDLDLAQALGVQSNAGSEADTLEKKTTFGSEIVKKTDTSKIPGS